MARTVVSRTISALLDDLQARGRYVVTAEELLRMSGSSRVALEAAVRRLKRKHRLVVPRRGFFVLVPLEYREAGAPPASWFIHDLARFLRQPYYVGLLSAAALHGAAHQQPMVFQVITDRPTRPVRVGRGRIDFHQSRVVSSVPTVSVQTETGTMRVSTPETTAFDLVRLSSAAGQLNNVATVLTELAEKIDPVMLMSLSDSYAVPDIQRLGFLLEHTGHTRHADALHEGLTTHRVRPVLLAPREKRGRKAADERWRVIPNVTVEADT